VVDSCQACGSAALRVFYRVEQVPVHSCLLMPTEAEAIAYPKGDLGIALCEACAFVQNNRFEASVHEYSPRYEETQAFSPTFRAFVKQLTRRYAEAFGVRGPDKLAVEIGCGKGEFLVALCEELGCRGVGIDPGCRPERIESEASDRIEWIRDFYGEAYGELDADLVFCRHTLEHIQPVQQFLQTVRRAIGDRPGTAVAFELPDMERVLTDFAFWDIYYEHCSYFTAGSLRRLFQRAGFEVVAEDKVYDGQYLLIDAYPGAAASTSSGAAESDDVRETASQVARFEEVVSAELAKWRAYFEDAAARGEQVVLWGSGSKAVAFLTTLGLGDEVACVTDINPFRHGMFMPGSGHRIVPPEDLALLRPQRVVAMNAIYQQEIAQQLRELGVDAALVAV